MPPALKKIKSKRAKKSKSDGRGETSVEVSEWDSRVVVRPPLNQLRLSNEQLEEDANIFLRARNPQAPRSIARFSHRDLLFKNDPTIDQIALIYRYEGYLAHRVESEAGREQADKEEAVLEVQRRSQERIREMIARGIPIEEVEEEMDAKRIRNQFNFSDRASQTLNNPLRERMMETEPPPTKNKNGEASRSAIFDAYIQHFQSQSSRDSSKKKDSDDSVTLFNPPEDPTQSKNFPSHLKVIDRMVVQNIFSDISYDFKYYVNEADFINTEDASLLPLWSFQRTEVESKHITDIRWNPKYPDLFAVAFGSFDFLHPRSGVIYCFSLKNPVYPECAFFLDIGVTCLDFHPEHPSLLAVGLYDGTVLVFDIRQKSQKPLFQSTVRNGKHTEPVWQVQWDISDESALGLNFYSVSADGRVSNWILSKTELLYTDILELKHVSESDDWNETLSGLESGFSLAFHPTLHHMFLVGTEEGNIHRCSKAYTSQYIMTYKAHTMPVYRVQWNPFNSDLFISCAGDWTLHIWHIDEERPLMSFDLGSPVNDVSWAPYSSTVFAAVTADSKVHVFDLTRNKNEPICSQAVVRKSKLTRLTFSRTDPVLLVGDNRGHIISAKLSPNLCRVPQRTGEEDQRSDLELQLNQLDGILRLAKLGEVIIADIDRKLMLDDERSSLSMSSSSVSQTSRISGTLAG